jgi:hypothetical protein
MLKLLFEWFDTHAQSYWIIAAIPTLLLLTWSVRLIWRNNPEWVRSKRQEVFFALLVLAVLMAWRWPFLLSADEYNPDESQLIAGAITLQADWVPWRGVDGFTSGPLNFYPLLLPKAFGLPLDYFTARLVGLLLIWGALLACYRLFVSWFGEAFACLGILPALAFFCTVTDQDFIHYSSEHLPLFLIGLSTWCILCRQPSDAQVQRWKLAGCFVAGLLPWAKLQSAPIAAVLVGIGLIQTWSNPFPPESPRLRRIACLLIIAITPTFFFLLIVALSGESEHFFRSYVLQNFSYVGDGATLFGTTQELWRTSCGTFHFPLFLLISLLGIAVGSIATKTSRRPGPSSPAALVLFAISVVCILTPRRSLLHYLLLSIIPLSVCFGFILGRWGNSLNARGRVWLGLSVLLVGYLSPVGLRALQPAPEMFGNFAMHWQEPRTWAAEAVRSYAFPASRLAVWGWLPSLYVETALPQGTRDGNTSWAIMASPQREYYRQRFLADLQRNNPDLFVDAVGRGSPFFTDRLTTGHESFPSLREFIHGHYQLVAEQGYVRVYAKKGLPGLDQAHDWALNSEEPSDALHRESLNPSDLPRRSIKHGLVQLMNPPAEIVWSLEENVREVRVEYGFTSEAYRSKDRSDGAALIFELHSPGVPVRHLFFRELDPRNRPSDRGPITSRIILPPFRPGARLIARTKTGASGKADWIYLGRITPLRMATYSASQFPHFNRVPDLADADLSYLLQDPDDNILILHAPASLTYNLRGTERRLRFDYGFRSGAYSNGGQTDGATFEVSLQHTDGTVQVLFQKELNPLGKEADRGNQSADFALPSESAGARLVVRIDPGKGNAWDWTYITNFVLE